MSVTQSRTCKILDCSVNVEEASDRFGIRSLGVTYEVCRRRLGAVYMDSAHGNCSDSHAGNQGAP